MTNYESKNKYKTHFKISSSKASFEIISLSYSITWVKYTLHDHEVNLKKIKSNIVNFIDNTYKEKLNTTNEKEGKWC